MNETPHETDPEVPEETLPDDPLSETDALLDALVDAESEPDPSRGIPKKLVVASVLLGIALWQFIHISKGGEPLFQPAAHENHAPTKTRSERLMRLRMELQSINSVAAYIARAKRGMTDQEIRWMIEDFQAAGLDQDETDLKGARRAKEQLWYLQAMTEALQLSPQQKAQAKGKMDALLAADVKTSEPGIAGVGKRELFTRIPDATPVSPPADAKVWLFEDTYAPWNLCDLTYEQDRLTMHEWRDAERKNKPAVPESAQTSLSWMRISTTRQDPMSGNLIELGNDNPYAPGFPEGYMILGRIMVVDAFPLAPEQKPHENGVSGLDQARSLQAPQLRMALLLDASVASRLLAQLDHSITRQDSNENRGVIIKKEDGLPLNPFSGKTAASPDPK